MSETTLFFELACQRLVNRSRSAGLVLALALLIPYEVVDNRPQFLWGLLAALAPTLAGIAIFIASYRLRDPASLAIAVLASLSSAALLIRMGADAAAWDVLPLPESLSERPAPVLVSLALTAAGVELMAKPHARKVARWILYSSLALAVLYYVRPVRGEAPITTVWAMLRWLGSFPYWRMALGLLILLAMALAPAAISIAGVVRARRPPKLPYQRTAIPSIAVYGPPAMMLMLVYRSFFSAAVGAHILGTIGTTFVVAALLGVIASAVEVLGEAASLSGPKAEIEPPPARNLKPAGRAALAIAAPILILQAALSRPPAKGVEWTLRPSSEEGDRLFGALVPAWDEARLGLDRAASGDAQALATEAARSMVDAARPLDQGLASALEELGSSGFHVAGRRFYRLVADVNEASRSASLPYYVDPIVAYGPTGDGLTRHLLVHAYTVERVQSFGISSGSKRFATLHVRQLGRRRMGHRLLGLSRDVQPFALVVLDEVEPFGRELAELAAASPPVCGVSASEAAREGLERCGAVLAGALGQAPDKVAAAVLAVTERHELQHQVDGPHLPTARAVSRKLAGVSDEEIDRVNRELSAYLSELTAEGAPASLGLIRLLRFALLSRGVEHLVAIIAFEALSGRSMGRGSLAAVELSKAFAELSALPDEALRARAADAWGDLFGGTLPSLERGPG
jgi:hypothetical protein